MGNKSGNAANRNANPEVGFLTGAPVAPTGQRAVQFDPLLLFSVQLAVNLRPFFEKADGHRRQTQEEGGFYLRYPAYAPATPLQNSVTLLPPSRGANSHLRLLRNSQTYWSFICPQPSIPTSIR